MIKINLQGETKDYTLLYITHALAVAGALLSLFILFTVLQISANSSLSKLEKVQEKLSYEDTKLDKVVKEVQTLDTKRKWLADKLTTIARLKAVKQSPVRVLDALTTSVPEKSWIKTVNKRGDSIEFEGVALDNQTISLLMRQLENSDYFDKVDLLYSKQQLQNDVPLMQFSLNAKLSDPLKEFKKIQIENEEGKKKGSKKRKKKKKE